MNTTAQHQQEALTAAQQNLVENNLGLVALHIRRYVSGARRGSGQRDYDDLFQEGCCGLALAARNYDPASGMSFPAYALPRIRMAISTALTEKSGLVRVPRQRRRADADKADPRNGERGPRVQGLVDRPVRTRHDDVADDGEVRTVGERLREKYDLALASARRALRRRKCVRADRDVVATRVLGERLAIAEPEERTPLRRIALETGSSHARVVQCEQRLIEEARRALVGDMEFQGLQEVRRRSADGVDTFIDPALDARLRGLAAEGFCRRWKSLARPGQAEYALRLLEALAAGGGSAMGSGSATGGESVKANVSAAGGGSATGGEFTIRELFCRLPVATADALSQSLAAEVQGPFAAADAQDHSPVADAQDQPLSVDTQGQLLTAAVAPSMEDDTLANEPVPARSLRCARQGLRFARGPVWKRLAGNEPFMDRVRDARPHGRQGQPCRVARRCSPRL